ncbi:YcxB family protein [Bowmanella yangjiangensis]|uniref:YcxB family protein n=1 Tax=Bowmanella yangjiangensis TaxID=2811230 RepID=A0ABS3CNI8_9ALTE|nr:YcxB family protein [Bowmanella yangjiangensis]MBN7818677.1 YcxB family protein [Bowmanella yangjiangensis]
MKITTNISRMDLIKFNLRFLPFAPITYKYFGIVALFIFSYVLWSKGVPTSFERWKILIVGSLIGGFFATVFYFGWCVVSILFLSKESNGVLGEHEYEITEDGLFERTIANETLNRWGALGKVSIAGKNLLLQVSGYLYHLFPRRSFESDEAFYEFKNLLIENINNAKNTHIKTGAEDH